MRRGNVHKFLKSVVAAATVTASKEGQRKIEINVKVPKVVKAYVDLLLKANETLMKIKAELGVVNPVYELMRLLQKENEQLQQKFLKLEK